MINARPSPSAWSTDFDHPRPFQPDRTARGPLLGAAKTRDFVVKKLLFALAIPLSACASDIMQSYVGRDITSVMATYGPPYQQFDLPDGRVAFQWRLTDVENRPQETIVSGAASDGRFEGRVVTYQAHTTQQVCFYTFYTARAARSGAGTTIVGFERPSFECE